jgi:hypothetical protein
MSTDGPTDCDSGLHVHLPFIDDLLTIETRCAFYSTKHDAHELGKVIEQHPKTTEIAQQAVVKIGAWGCAMAARSKVVGAGCGIFLDLVTDYVLDVIAEAYHNNSCLRLKIKIEDLPRAKIREIVLDTSADSKLCR